MSSFRNRGSGSNSQQSASSGASNPKQRKNSTKTHGTDKSKPNDEPGDIPQHLKPTYPPTYVSQVTIPAKSKQHTAAAETPKQKIDAILDPHHPGVYQSGKQVVKSPEESEHYKDEYRRMKSDYTKLCDKHEKLERELATTKAQLKTKKGNSVAQLTDALTKRDTELKTKERMLQQVQESHDMLEREYRKVSDYVPHLEADLKEKTDTVLQLTVDISKQDEEIKSHKARLEGQHQQLVSHVTKVKEDLAAKHAHLRQQCKKTEEDLQAVTQLHLAEVNKRKFAEQQLVDVKMELAKLKEKTDEFVFVDEPSKQTANVKEMEDTVSALTKRLDEMIEELEKSKSSEQTSAVRHQQILDQMIAKHQKQIQELEDDMQNKTAEYEQNLKAKENAEKSKEWSRVKMEESEGIIKQLHSTIDEYNVKMEAVKKESENNLDKERQQRLQLANEIDKLQGDNKKWEAAVNKLKSELSEVKDTKQTLKKEHEEIQAKLTHAWEENDKLLHEKDDLTKQLENTMKNSTKELDRLKAEVKMMEGNKQAIGQTHQEMLQHESVDLIAHGEKDDEIKTKEEKIRQLECTIKDQTSKLEEFKTGNKEREDRIAELEDFINDQVTELDKMEAAMKQTVANKEFGEKELNEALEKKQAELDALKVAYEKEKEICQSVSPGDKEEPSHVSSELAQAEEKLTEANKQLLSYKEEIQKLKETLAKQESTSSQGNADADGLRETVKRLTRDDAMLRQQNSELKRQNESLSKRRDNYKSSSELLTEMMQKQPGMEMETKVATKITELNQQVTHLQDENEKFQSLTTAAANKPSHGSDEEFRYQGHIDQPAQLQKRLKELESELESTKSTLEAERKKYEEKLKEEAFHQQSTSQHVTIGKTSRDYSPDDMDQLLKENEEVKQTQNQLYESYQKLKDRYRENDEEVDELRKRYSQLQTDFETQRVELNKAKEELERASGLNKLIQEQHVMTERDRDTTATMTDQKESEQKAQIELNAKIVELRNNHSLLIKSKDDEIEKLRNDVDSKEFEISELIADKKDLQEKLARRRSRISTPQVTTFDSDRDTEVLQGSSRESTHPSSKNSALVTVASENLLQEKEQTIEKLSKEVERLQKQQMKSSDDSGVGGPCVEHTQSGGVGESPNEGIRHTDDSYTKRQLSQLQSTIDELTRKLTVEQRTTEDTKIQLSQSQSRVDELTKELAVERSVTDNAKNEMDKLMSQLQQLQNDKRTVQQQMNAGYKEREDRIAELEEFINDQVTELDKMEAAMKQTVANKQLLEKDYQKLSGYYDTAKKTVEEYQERIFAQEDTISELESKARQNEENANNAITTLEQQKEGLIQSNQKMSREVARLMLVDGELQHSKKEIEKYKLEIRKAEEELQTKEFMLNTYKEDFEAERKDRENAHNIKEDEITKVRIEMETFEAQCQQKVHNIKQAMEAQMNTLKEQANHYAKENDRLKKECGRLHGELDKEKRDAQSKSDVYKKKTEQFQLQWRKREDAEARVNTLTEQLNAQYDLNKQLNSTIDSLMRKSKGIDPQIPSNNMASQQSQQRRVSPHNPPFSNMSAPMDTSSDHHHTSTTMSMSKPRPPYDPSTNVGMAFQQPPPSSTIQQPPSSSSQQQAWQMQQRHYKAQQQHQQDQLYLRGQGRGPSHNQPMKPLHEGIHYPPDYHGQGKNFLPPSNIDNYQPRSIQPEYNVAGTNAAPMQGQFPHDDYNYGRNSGPASLDSSITKSRSAAGYTNHPPPDQSPLTAAKRAEKPTQYASEGINEEIRYQADKQRRHQEYERFDSTLQLDPYLICPKCKLQFREGQLPEYRHHIDNCNQ